jgi:hypothetical protein
MSWTKKGLILAPANKSWWDKKYAMMPTPIYLKELGVIRVFYGTTDEGVFGRTAYVDLDPQDPSKIIDMPGTFVADLGDDGCFDDSGAIPSSIVKHNNSYYLYYVGFQRTVKVPYMLFSGLMISGSMQEINFSRYSKAPLIDRSKDNYVSNAAPFVLYDQEEKLFKMWYWVGSNWVTVNGKKYIRAEIHYATSANGLAWSVAGLCLAPEKELDEFSLGRPWVIKSASGYEMYYSTRYVKKLYRISYATSSDGITWKKKPFNDFDVSPEGWDSEMTCYCSVVDVENKRYMFYNGNNNGETGFGFAEMNLEK